MHWCCKDVCIPIDFIANGFSDQKKPSNKRFYHQVGTTIKILKRDNLCANRDELFIGFLKEAVRKDMRESSSPMVL